MNTLKSLLVTVCFLISTISAFALPENEKYFIGKWNITVTGLPQGEALLKLNIENKDDALSGMLILGKDTFEIYELEVDDTTISFIFSTESREVNLSATKKDDNTMEGSVMERYDLVALRVKEDNK